MKKLILLWAMAGTFSAYAQDKVIETAPAAFSLQQAIDYALKNQKDVKNALLEEQVAKQKVHEVTGSGLPQINATLDFKDYLKAPVLVFNGQPISIYPQYNVTPSLEGSQLLFSGEYLVGLQASKVYLELSKKSTESTRIDLISTVTKAYYNTLIAQERMELLNANVNRVRKTLEDTKAFFNNGLVEKIDVDRLTVTYNGLLVEQDKVKRLVDVSILLLKFQIGLDIKANLTLTDKLANVEFDPATQISADKFDYSKRVEYSLFETQSKLARLDLKRNKFAYLPNAAAYASMGKLYMSNNLDLVTHPDNKSAWFPMTVVGAKVTLPIFSGLQRNAKYQQAKLKTIEAENNLDFIRQSIDLELASSLVTLQNASATYNIQKENIQIAEEVVRVSKIKYEQGVGSNLELITAETALKEAQTNYYGALFDALVAKIDFDKANGNIK
jgi:outer membrane protein TolC